MKTAQQRFLIGLLLFLSAISVGILLFAWLWLRLVSPAPLPASGDGQARVQIDETTFLVDLAIRAETQATGLAYRDALAQDRGMLFLFPEEKKYTFWMHGMRFPIDIIWIRDHKVVEISHSVSAPVQQVPSLPIYAPETPADTVLEINAGLAQSLGIAMGDDVSWEILTSD